MRLVWGRIVAGAAATFCAALSLAGTLTVTSPTANAYIGSNSNVSFTLRGSAVEALVRAEVTGPAGAVTTSEQRFTPNLQGEVQGSLPLRIAESTPEGAYTLVVTVTEPNNPYNEVRLNVQVDAKAPKLLDFSPNNGSFAKGTVTIRATVQETNVRDWRVRVNDQDIPNNTGTGNTVTVAWNSATIERDGPQTVSIRVQDQAGNELTHNFSVTLDRVAPVINIVYPTAGLSFRRSTTMNVVVDISDATASSVDVTGIDVLVTDANGKPMARPYRTAFTPGQGNTVRWTGRIPLKWIPKRFKIRVTAVDRAGNAATPQETALTIR